MERPLRILLVEDNPGDAFLIKFYLEESIFSDAELSHVEFIETAQKQLEEGAFDVVLLDLNLPDSKGIETLEGILDRVKDGVVIVLTGLTDEELGVRTVQMGAQDFLVKGQFDGKVLTSSIRYAFERYQLQKQVRTFTRELNERNAQFKNAQKIAKLGYWELSPRDNSMIWSDELYNLMKVDKNNFHPNLDEMLSLVGTSGAAEIRQALDEVAGKNREITVEVSFRLKGNDDPDNIYYFKGRCVHANGEDAKVIGVIQAIHPVLG